MPEIVVNATVLDGLDRGAEDRAVASLKADGFAILDQALPPETCDRLLDFALQAPARIRLHSSNAVYARGKAQGVRYDFHADDVVNLPDVQALLSDGFLLRVAQRYLGATPLADVTSMWWHTNFQSEPDAEAAQFYHFDLDRPKWMKIFCYLTDVGPDNGPHCFVRGSHRNSGIPWNLRAKGYARLGDDDVENTFGKDRIEMFTASRGTILLEDSRGLHKGLHVRSGDRLMLQLQFSDSLFGGAYPPVRFRRPASPILESRIRAFPLVYANFTGGSRYHE